MVKNTGDIQSKLVFKFIIRNEEGFTLSVWLASRRINHVLAAA